MTATLATIRARIRDQVENAWGAPDPLPVKTSSETLTTLRNRVELQLHDSGNHTWTTTTIDEAIEKALEEYNRHSPALKVGTHTVATAAREQDISAITDILRIVRVWWPYDSADPDWPPNWVQFNTLPGSILSIEEPSVPQVNDVIRIWYTTPATLNGLGGASATTIPDDDLTYLINGAVYYAARTRALSYLGVDAAGPPDPPPATASAETLATLRDRLELDLRDTSNLAWTTTELDEAIEQAIEDYDAASPQLLINDFTVSSPGREQDISAITGLLDVKAVWFPYTAAALEYPPAFVGWQLYPGSILHVDAPTAPTATEHIRIWYTKAHTLDGLNGASATTIPQEHVASLLDGAAAVALRTRSLRAMHSDPPDPRLAAASAETLTTLRDRVELHLQDSTNATWATGDIDEAIEKAIEEYSAISPQLLINDFTVSSPGREQDISAITGLLDVKAVWFPYTAAALEYPPAFVGWKLYPGSILYVDATTAPANTEHIRIWYTKAHTLDGLNAAGATTIPQEHITYIINGAAAYCALERQVEISEDLTVDDDTITRIKEWGDAQRETFNQNLGALVPPEPTDPASADHLHSASTARAEDFATFLQAVTPAPAADPQPSAARALQEWATDAGKGFRYGIRKAAPAWQRYAYGFRNDDIDEAVRWALGKFNEIAPEETIDTHTVSTAGREQDISAFTDLLRVTRVWWPYDSSDPAYEPNWVPFEQWGTTLYIKSASEPAAADVVRLWYERLCTINGLDSASSTTIPDDAENLIVTGAVGYVTEERIMEEPATRWRIPRALKEWAAARLKDFDRGLQAHAKRQAVQHAGVHELPALDRWDNANEW